MKAALGEQATSTHPVLREGHQAGRDFSQAIHTLNQANQALKSMLEVALSPLGITAIQYSALRVISENEGISSAQLARHFFVTPQTMNELIAALQRRDLIARKEDPDNRRILKMSLTIRGRDIKEAADGLSLAIEQEVFSRFAPEQYQGFRELCQGITRQCRPAVKPVRQSVQV